MPRSFNTRCSLKALTNGFVYAGLLFLGITSAHILWAQATAGIHGTVVDSSGAAVPGAQVIVKNGDTGIAQTFTSDALGRYSAPSLPIGNYEVDATRSGFQTVNRPGITLTVGSDLVVDIKLAVGQSQQTITIEAQVSQVETSSAAISNLVDQTEMRELPLNGRNFEQLISLAPGVIPIGSGGMSGGISFYGQQQNYSISGSRNFGPGFLIDDTDTAGFWNHGTGSGALGTNLGIDSIAEFQTLTNTYSAQFGAAGAVINASTKSGTNQFHGSLYEFLRNSAIEARPFFSVITSSTPPYRQNQFGGTAGGPIKKDKAFFFVNYEGLRASQDNPSKVVVPDANAHAGFLPCAVATGFACNAATQLANVGVAPNIASTMALYPNAQSEILSANGSPTGTGYYYSNPNTTGYENYLVARFDYTLSSKDNLFVRYTLDRATRVAEASIPIEGEKDLTRNNYVTLEERRIVSPTLVNSAHFSFVRSDEQGLSAFTNSALQYFPGSGRIDGTVSPGSGVATLGASQTLPFYLIPNKFTLGDDVIWTHGSHNITAGMNVVRTRDNTWSPDDIGGVWSFANLTGFLQSTPTQLVGELSAAQAPTSDAVRDVRELDFAPYFQDNWKVSSRVTLNLGVRYAPTTNPVFVNHLVETLVDAPYGNYVPSVHPFKDNVSLNNWDPRLGIAWDVFGDHKTSIRAGFGIFHDVVIARNFGDWLQPPFLTGSQTVGLTYPIPFTNVAPGVGTSIPTNGSLTCSNCVYYNESHTPYTEQYNFNIQRQITSSTILTVGYVGSHGVHLEDQHDFNYPVPTIGSNGRQVFGVYSGSGNTITANPRLDPTWNYESESNTDGLSHYNALQTSLNRRFSKGISAQLSYTWSKSMDDSSGVTGLDGGSAWSNPTNAMADYGPSTFNRTNNFRISVVYQVPFRPSNRFANALIGGWQVSSISSVASGSPFSVSDGFARTFTGSNTTPRPDFVAGCPLYPSQQTVSNWFNTACYTIEPIGEYGNLGRDTLTGPRLINFDASLSKEVRVPKLGEKGFVQFRAEFFNIINHPSFGNPSSSLYTQSGASYTANATVNTITTQANTPRDIQFALKVRF